MQPLSLVQQAAQTYHGLRSLNPGGVRHASPKSEGVSECVLKSGGVRESPKSAAVNEWSAKSEGVRQWGGVKQSGGVKQCWLRSGGVRHWWLKSGGVIQRLLNTGGVRQCWLRSGGVRQCLLRSGDVRSAGVRHCRVKSGGVRLCCLRSGGVRQCSLNVSDSPSDISCKLPLLLPLLLLLTELESGSIGTLTSDIWMTVSDCWSAWLRVAMYFMASLSVVILVSFSLPLLSCWFWWEDMWGTARRSVSKAAFISRMRSLSRAFAVFRRYLLRGGGFCFGRGAPEVPSPLLDLALAAALPRSSVSARFCSDRGLSEYLSPRFGADETSSCLSVLVAAPPALLLGSVWSLPFIGVNNMDVRIPAPTESGGRRVKEFMVDTIMTSATYGQEHGTLLHNKGQFIGSLPILSVDASVRYCPRAPYRYRKLMFIPTRN